MLPVNDAVIVVLPAEINVMAPSDVISATPTSLDEYEMSSPSGEAVSVGKSFVPLSNAVYASWLHDTSVLPLLTVKE